MANFIKGTDKMVGETAFNAHVNNLDIHVTAEEKANWNLASGIVLTLPKYETNDEGLTYLSDSYISEFFGINKTAFPGTESKQYGVEWAAWPDLSTAITGTQVTPWRQTYMTDPEIGIRKLDDNKGLVAAFHQYGISTGDEQDDYTNIPAFMWWHCNYVKDKYGNVRLTAIKGIHDNYAEIGDVDVGVLQMACYVKYEKTVNNDETIFSRTEFADLYEQYGGVPVHRFWITLTPPAGDDSWHPVSAAVRHDGTVAPYCIRTPYLAGTDSSGIYRSQPGMITTNNISYTTIWNYYVRDSKKGVGYMGGSMEVQAWGWLMLMMKHGYKSSQDLCYGVSAASAVFPAEYREEATSKVFTVSSADAANLYPGLWVSLQQNQPRQNFNVTSLLNTSATISSTGFINNAASAYYVDGNMSVRIRTVTARTDDSGLVDVVLETPDNFAVSTKEVDCAAYQKEDGTILGTAYNTNWADTLKYKENSAWDGTTAATKFVPSNNQTAYYLRDTYEAEGKTWPVTYQYVPDLYMYQGIDRGHIETAFPRSGMTDLVPGRKDGCIGNRTKAWSPFRIQGLEFGQGVFDLAADVMNVSIATDADTYVPHAYLRDKNAQNHTGKSVYSWADSTTNFVDAGAMSTNWNKYPVEFLFTSIILGDTNFGTAEAPRYVNCGIWPSNEPTYQPGAGATVSYGDYYWGAAAVNGQYEVFTGGSVINSDGDGLLYVVAYGGLPGAAWPRAFRD